MGSKKQFVSEEIVTEILSWAPAKSLLRFRAVCKSWNMLISNPSFVKLHLHRSATNDDLTRLQIIPKSQFHDLHDHNSRDVCQHVMCVKHSVVGSCNGLVCVVLENIEQCGVYLWNIAMRLRSQKSPPISFGEGFELESIRFGFGHDNLSDTYKVVALLLGVDSLEDTLEVVAKVYSTGDSCWRDLESFPNLNYIEHGIDDGVYVKGTLNWIGMVHYFTYEEVVIEADLVIVSLDLGKETCRPLFLPDGLGPTKPTLGVLRDTLCVWHDCNTHFIIWQMKEFRDNMSWIQLVNVSYFNLQIDPTPIHSMIPLHMSKNEDVLILSSVRGLEWVAILYNPRNHRLRRFPIPNHRNMVHFEPKVFTESLVIPC
ncbi:F-box/kelch-repeat protein At3g23880 [Cajanus cajan]|uniref:F-box/kelch-repeat protein At3g23880 family n=1 Tax=Cajanus cajan TaxID=3821 RepID=A0A151T911_CAJCA|nr:F-box/kelch-repeat protein At3g23880 [Cajanus cajan]KYP63484.1 F-box/kelch-repeat protein At3g23880 family [Cajanus cajan]